MQNTENKEIGQQKKPDNNSKNVPVKRVPVHKQKKHDYSEYNLDFKNFQYRWVNCIEGDNKIEIYEKGGYEQVFEKDSKPIKRRMGKGQDGYQYLMRIPKEIYIKDQNDKLEEPRSIENDMNLHGYSRGQLSSNVDPRYLVGNVKINSNNIEPR